MKEPGLMENYRMKDPTLMAGFAPAETRRDEPDGITEPSAARANEVRHAQSGTTSAGRLCRKKSRETVEVSR